MTSQGSSGMDQARNHYSGTGENLFTGIFSTAIDPIITINEKGMIELFNHAAEKAFGYQANEVIGKNVKILMPSPYFDEHDGYLNNYNTSGVRKIIGIGREVAGLRKDGSTFPLHLSVSEALLENRRIFVGIGRDITILKNSERRLKESEERVRAIVDHAVDSIITIKSNGIVENFNAAATRMFGYSPQEVIGKNVSMLMPQNIQKDHDLFLKNYMQTGQRKIIGIGREVIAKKKDGTSLPVHLSISEYTLGGERYFTGIIRDLSDIKVIQDELRESEEKSSRILETAVDSIITVNSRGIIQSVNPSAVRNFGYSPDEVVGKNVSILMPSPYKDEHDQYLKNFLTTGVKKIIGIGREVVARRKDGSQFPIHLSISEYKTAGETFFAGIARDITAFKKSEEKFRLLVEAVKDYAILMLDSNGFVVSWNEGVKRIKGYDENEIIGRHFSQFYTQEEVVAGSPQRELECARIKGSHEEEGVRVRKDGSIFYANVTITALKDQEGNVTGYSKITRDITDTKKRQQEIENKNLELARRNWMQEGLMILSKAALNNKMLREVCDVLIREVSQRINAHSGVLYIIHENKVAKFISGYAFQSFHTKHQEFVIGEGLVGQVISDRSPLRVSGLNDTNYRTATALGEILPKEIYVKPITLNQDILAVIELMSLNGFQEQHLEFLDAASNTLAISIASAQARDRAEILLGQTKIQAEELEKNQRELQIYNAELDLKTRELQGKQIEMKQTNEELKEQRGKLEEQKLFLESANRELERSKQELEDKANQLLVASRYKSEFLANVSHELRTPLNSIMVLSRIIAENKGKNLTPDDIESATIIYSSGKDLLNLINDILDLSKVEAGKIEINHENISSDELINNIEKQFKRLFEGKNVAFKLDRSPDFPSSFVSDRLRLEQILRNFLSNALKFTAQGEVKISFFVTKDGTKFGSEDGSETSGIGIAVKDTGTGIPADKFDNIFEAFQQVDGSISKKYGGTGLGLSIAKGLAEKIGGYITLESETNVGSTFTIFIPYSKSMEIELGLRNAKHFKDHREVKQDVSRPVPIYSDDRQIIAEEDCIALIIEDDHQISSVVSDFCRSNAFKCIRTEFGLDGIREATKFRPHAILLDIGLPDVTGLSVLERIKSNSDLRHIPVITISGYERRAEALKLGALAHFSKPINFDGLEAALQRANELTSSFRRNLLILSQDTNLTNAVREFFQYDGLTITIVNSEITALEKFRTETFDCVMVDLKAVSTSNLSLFESMIKLDDSYHSPIVVFQTEEMSPTLRNILKKYSEDLPISVANSLEALYSEIHIFLHQDVSHLSFEKRSVISDIKNRTDVVKGKKILIVDDDVRNIYALRSVLIDKGAILEEAYSGQEAIQIINEVADIDLVLMDIMMPEMDGYQAIQEIRKSKNRIPIIALTAKAMKEDRQKCFTVGASDFLSKPIDTEHLFSTLKVWLT